jgi:hypothetical protein
MIVPQSYIKKGTTVPKKIKDYFGMTKRVDWVSGWLG